MRTQNSSDSSIKKREIILAVKNGLKLTSSLFITLGIAFAIRFWMPKFLGPESFGVLYFAEEFAITFFTLATLGAETYIRKEVATRTEHASEFFGVLILFRVFVVIILIISMTVTLFAMGKNVLVFRLVYLFTAGQLFFLMNTTLSTLLQTKGTVNELAVINSISKVLWGLGIVTGLLFFKRLEVVGSVFFVTEFIKTPILYAAAQRHLNLKLHLNFNAGKTMLVASLPFFINYLAYRIYAKIDVMMISAMTTDKEVGWYGAAVNLNNVVLLIMPVVTAVVMPMGARIAQKDIKLHNETMRSAIRLVLMLIIPLAFFVSLNAEDIVFWLFKAEYGPTVTSLRILAPVVPLTFLCVLLATQLINLNKKWQVAYIALVGLMLNPVLNYLIIIPVYKYVGNGGAGIAAASTTLFTEITVAVLLFISAGEAAFDKKLVFLLLRFILIGGLLAIIHYYLKVLGGWRGPAEVLIYPFIAMIFGTLPLKDFLSRGRRFLNNRN
jgi:O-antigen/teichoic acid export membrane protein